MKTPICEVCVKSGILCSACEQKLEKGEITELDVDLARFLYKLERRALIKDVSFEKTLVIEDFIFVTTKGNIANMIGRGGRIVRLLSKEFGKKVRIVNSGDIRLAMQDLVMPARVLGINIVYKPDGEYTKVILPKEDKEKLIAELELLQEAARKISGDRTIVFELR